MHLRVSLQTYDANCLFCVVRMCALCETSLGLCKLYVCVCMLLIACLSWWGIPQCCAPLLLQLCLHGDYQCTHYHQHTHSLVDRKKKKKHALTFTCWQKHMTYCHMCHVETLTQHQL